MDINKEGAAYDSKETDELMTEELANRDDYGEKSNAGEPGNVYHDYLGDSQNFSGFPQPTNQQELWNRFKDWVSNKWKKKLDEKKKQVGKEHEKSNKPGDQPGTMGEGYWSYKNTPYVAPVQSPAFFEAMPAMKIGALDTAGLSPEALKEYFIEKLASVNREAAEDQWSDHHLSITFEFMPNEIKIMCNWDSGDLPQGLNEVQTLSRIVSFLEKKLPEAFLQFKHARAEDLDLQNRTVAISIPIAGEK